MLNEITCGDFLAGGGGVTEAMERIPGLTCKWVLNHDKMAIRTNMYNHKKIKHYWSDIYKQDEHEMEPVDLIWASIECTQHSRANGGKEKKIGSYTLGWELVRYIRFMMPKVIGIENVPEFKDWAPIDEDSNPIKAKKGEEFKRWKAAICSLGYEYHEKIMNAADFGIPTRRIRFFCFFTQIELGMIIRWPGKTHDKKELNGLKKWVACKHYINLEKEGESIFGRRLNPEVKKGKRIQLSPNTLRRIAGGIRKYAPELYFIFQYYSTGENIQSLGSPLNSITTKDRHVLVKFEKMQFIQDYCRGDIFNTPDEPISPQLNKKQMLSDYYGRDDCAHSLDGPAMTITTENSKHLLTIDFVTDGTFSNDSKVFPVDDPLNTITSQQRHQLITAKTQFISKQYNSNGHPELNNQSLNEPIGTLATEEKMQFISAYYNASGKPESQNQDIEMPLGSILTGTNKKALITALGDGLVDFDIRMRFLDPEELSRISTFPPKYFTDPRLKLTKKDQVKLIGNAVPPEWAKLIIEPVIIELQKKLQIKLTV